MRHILDPSTFDAMCEIYSLSFRRDEEQRIGQGSETTYAFALSHWKKRQVKLDELWDHDPAAWEDDMESNSPIGAVIYGEGGWTRWFVRLDGEVTLSRWNSNPEVCKKAEALGFRLY